MPCLLVSLCRKGNAIAQVDHIIVTFLLIKSRQAQNMRIHISHLLLVGSALAVDLNQPEFFSGTGAEGGYGNTATDAYDFTFFFERTGQKNSLDDTGNGFPAVDISNTQGNGLSVDGSNAAAIIAGPQNLKTTGGLEAFYNPMFPESGGITAFSLSSTNLKAYVNGITKMNTNGGKNGNNALNVISTQIQGGVRICGKSNTNDQECKSAAYLYLEDATGNLRVRFADGSGSTLASPLNKSVTLRMRKGTNKVYGTLMATKGSFDPTYSDVDTYVQISPATTSGNGESKADQIFKVSPDGNIWAFKFTESSSPPTSYCKSMTVEVLLSSTSPITETITDETWTTPCT